MGFLKKLKKTFTSVYKPIFGGAGGLIGDIAGGVGSLLGFGGEPPDPPVVPPVPTIDPDEAEKKAALAAIKAKQKALGSKGYAGSVLTGSKGLGAVPTGNLSKSSLGG